jgi:hypothetical protein
MWLKPSQAPRGNLKNEGHDKKNHGMQLLDIHMKNKWLVLDPILSHIFLIPFNVP